MEEEEINHISLSASWYQSNNERKLGLLYSCIVFALGISLSIYDSSFKDQEKVITRVYFSLLYATCIVILTGMIVYLHRNRQSTYEDLQQGKLLTKVQYSFGGEKLNPYLRLGVSLFGTTSVVVILLKIIRMFQHKSSLKYLPMAHYSMEIVFLIFQSAFLVRYHRVVFFQYKKLIGFCLLHLITTNLCIWSDKAASKVSKGLSGSQRNESMKDTPLDKTIDCLLPTITEYAVLAAAILFELSTRVGKKSSVELHCKQNPSSKTFWKRMWLAKLEVVCACFLFISAGAIAVFVLQEKSKKTFSKLIYPKVDREELNYRSLFLVNLTHSIELSIVLCVTVIISVLTYIYTRPLKFTVTYCKHSLDESLLYVSFFFTANYLLCGTVIAFHKGISSKDCFKFSSLQILRGIMGIVELIQVIFQTYLIQDTLYRCCSTERHKKEKPGRSSLAAMLAANFVLWLIASLQTKEADIVLKDRNDLCPSNKNQPDDQILRDLFLYATLPLLMLYRYHSTVCLSEIFSKIYQDEISRFADYWRSEGTISMQNGGNANKLAIITQNSANGQQNNRIGNSCSNDSLADFEKGTIRPRSSSIAVIPFPPIEKPFSQKRISKRRPTIRLIETARYHAESYELTHKMLNRKIVPLSDGSITKQTRKKRTTNDVTGKYCKTRSSNGIASDYGTSNSTPNEDQNSVSTEGPRQMAENYSADSNSPGCVPPASVGEDIPRSSEIRELRRTSSCKLANKNSSCPVIHEETEETVECSAEKYPISDNQLSLNIA